eukprot:TRINITY_DN33953_c0_g1_i1.p1 TRINITY_DN33953_c0_g1~~TRINITY_DN33953_c0_g1_i1.p1  ORF type:complete len:277 (-),score=30.57 TRINITY_DN33953_c0_g1_i1:11-742(-)
MARWASLRQRSRQQRSRLLCCVIAALTLASEQLASVNVESVAAPQALRRNLVIASVSSSIPLFAGFSADAKPSSQGDSLATKPFEWSFLWNDASKRSGSELNTRKSVGLPVTDVAAVLRDDLAVRKYILTGNLSSEVFSDECRFVDPNNAVDGLAKYRQALGFLFDPAESSLEVLDVRVAEGGQRIEADYIASGTIKLPWRPKIEPWKGHIEYTLNSEGLVVSQVDTWNITRFDAIRQTFTLR